MRWLWGWVGLSFVLSPLLGKWMKRLAREQTRLIPESVEVREQGRINHDS